MTLFNIIIDWIHIYSMSIVLGGSIVNILILRPIRKSLESEKQIQLFRLYYTRYQRVSAVSLFGLIVSGLFNISGRERGSLNKIKEWTQYHDYGDYGTYLDVKLILVLSVIILGSQIFGPRLENIKSSKTWDAEKTLAETDKIDFFEKLFIINIIVILFLAGSLLNRARFQDMTPILVDWFHLLGAGILVGSILSYSITFHPIFASLSGTDRTFAMSKFYQRYFPLIWISLGIQLISGVYNAPIQNDLSNWRIIFQLDTYSRVLEVKMIIITSIIVITLLLQFRDFPLLRKNLSSNLSESDITALSGQILRLFQIKVFLTLIMVFLASSLLNQANFSI